MSDRSRSRSVLRSVAIFAFAAFLPLATTGCFGKFLLLKKVYQFNHDISHDKWIQWFAFLVLNVVPIYSVATLIDAVLANSLEFWTGENPIRADAGTRRHARGPNGEELVLELRPDGSIEVRATDAQGRLQAFRVVREADALAAFDAEGRVIARVSEVGGAPMLWRAPAH